MKTIFSNLRKKKTLLLFVIWLVGCGTQTTNIPTVASISNATEAPEINLTTSTPLPRTSNQLTYSGNKSGDLYSLNLKCMTDETLCFDEPQLLLDKTKINSTTKPADMPGKIFDLDWSPDGLKLALCAIGLNGDNDIFFMDMSTTEPAWINLTHSSDNECNPKWDRNGEYLYYRACSYDKYDGCRLFSSDLSGGEKQKWLQNIDSSIGFFDISRDNKKMVFDLSDSNGHDQIYISDPDGSNVQQLTSGDADSTDPSFSSDGQMITFVRWNLVDSVDQSDIFVMDLVTGMEKNITEDIKAIVMDPAFSPDGGWLAFNTYDSGPMEASIFAYSIKNSSMIQVTSDNAYSIKPSWRRFSGQK